MALTGERAGLGARLSTTALIIVAVALGLTARADASATPVTINCSNSPGALITQPGSYKLDTAVTNCAANPIVELDGSGITLDLAGRRIDGDGNTYQCIVVNASNQSKIKIMNGSVSRCLVGVYIEAATSSTVTGMTVIAQRQAGIRAGSGNTITGNSVFSNGEDGILAGANDVITNNNVAMNGSKGIELTGGNSTITGNAIRGNQDSGLVAGDENIVSGNTCFQNGDACVKLGSNNTISKNTSDEIYAVNGNKVTGNKSGPVPLVSLIGPAIFVGNGNTVTGNTALPAAGAGIIVTGPDNVLSKNKIVGRCNFDPTCLAMSVADGNTIVQNSILNTGAGRAGLAVDAGDGLISGTVLKGNVVNGNRGDGIAFFDPSEPTTTTVEENTANGNTGVGINLSGYAPPQGLGTNTCEGNAGAGGDAGLCA